MMLKQSSLQSRCPHGKTMGGEEWKGFSQFSHFPNFLHIEKYEFSIKVCTNIYKVFIWFIYNQNKMKIVEKIEKIFLCYVLKIWQNTIFHFFLVFKIEKVTYVQVINKIDCVITIYG